MRCIKGALEYAIVMRFTHVSTAHYTYSWFLLSYASRTKCYNESATRMLLPQSSFTQWSSLFCYSIWILSLLVIGLWFYFWTIGMLYGLFLNRSGLPSSECSPCSSSSPVALPQHSVGFSAICRSYHKSECSSYLQLYLSRSLPMLGMFATVLTEALLMESRRYSAADLALLVN